MANKAQIPFHDLPADKLIEKLEVVKHKSTLDEDEAALFLNITIHAIRALRYKRKIAYCKNGDRIQYEMTALMEYKRKSRVSAMTLQSPAMA